MVSTTRCLLKSLQSFCWILLILVLAKDFHFCNAASLQDLEDSKSVAPVGVEQDATKSNLDTIGGPAVDKRRLRFVRRSSPASEYLVEDPEFVRDTRAPRLRYYKRNTLDDSAYWRDERAPRLRYYKRDESDAIFERDARAPRLRFVKRELENDFDRSARAPRLRFVKRSAQNELKSPNAGLNGHSRKKRSIFSPTGVTKRRLSINNDIRAIADMIHYEERRRLIEKENELRRRLLEIGKRSSGSESIGDIASPSEASGRDTAPVVKALADSLVDYALNGSSR